MTDLAFMVREDWAQEGTAMAANGAVIREWLGGDPILFAVGDASKFDDHHRNADADTAQLITGTQQRPQVVSIADLPHLTDKGNIPVAAVLHPYAESDCETIREVVDAGLVGRLFVMVWASHELIRVWMEGRGAVNLHTGSPCPGLEPVQVAAAGMMVGEEYNGLDTGVGKDTVVGLLRAFTTADYPLDRDVWLRCYFAAGGSFRHADAIEKFIKQMKAGTTHRVNQRFRDNIIEVLRHQVAESA